MLLHCGNAGILLLCNEVVKAAIASLQGTMCCGTKQLHIALQSTLSPWSATLIATEGEKLSGPDFWGMHLQEHEVNRASVLGGRIPPCSSHGSCSVFQQPLSTQPRFSEEPPALPCKPRSDLLSFTCYPCDQEELQVDPDSDPVSASHQGASCSTSIAVPYCFYKLVIPSPSEAVVSREVKSRRHGIYAWLCL